jgi:hypothetical protein
VWINWGLLSFAPPGSAVLAGDIYHELFHLGPHHIADLFGLSAGEVRHVDLPRLAAMPDWPEGLAYVAATRPPLFNHVIWEGGPARFALVLEQLVFVRRSIEIQATSPPAEHRDGDDGDGAGRATWTTASGEPVLVRVVTNPKGERYTALESAAFELPLHPMMPMRARFADDGRTYPLQEVAPGTWAVARPVPSIADSAAASLPFTLEFFERVRHHSPGVSPASL